MKKIYLSGSRGKGMFALVDDKDYSYLNRSKWYLDSNGYALRNLKYGQSTKPIRMHAEVIPIRKGFCCDHKNRIKLDNRSDNLREVTMRENAFNRVAQANSLSGFKGVSFSTKRQKWEVRIKINSIQKFLGYYEDLDDAVNARRLADVKYSVT